jgi:hypothetical protein
MAKKGKKSAKIAPKWPKSDPPPKSELIVAKVKKRFFCVYGRVQI